MIDPVGNPAAMPKTATHRDAKLWKAAQQLEGVFVQQLYKTMRETVPQQEGIVSGGAGEDIFTGLMDQHVAAETPKHWDTGLSEALYRQLRRSTSVDASATAPAAAPVPNSATPAL